MSPIVEYSPPSFLDDSPSGPFLNDNYFNNLGSAVKRVTDGYNQLDAAFTALDQGFVERAQDATVAMIVNGSHTGISWQYDDNLDRLSATVKVAIDIPESGTVRIATEANPDTLTNYVNEFRGVITQPLPAALPGRLIGFRQQVAGLTLQVSGSDTFRNAFGVDVTSLKLHYPGEMILFHCTTAGQWRTYGDFKPTTSIDARTVRHVVRALTEKDHARSDANTVHPNPPTISTGTTQPLTGVLNNYGALDSRMSQLGIVPVTANGLTGSDSIGYGLAQNINAWGWECYLNGTDLVIWWRATPDANAKWHIFIDDIPITATPVTPTNVSGVGNYYTRITFPTYGLHKITVLWQSASAYMFYTPVTNHVTAVERKRLRIACQGASFTASTAYASTLESWCWQFGRVLGAEILQAGAGGTGYVAAGSLTTFGSPARTQRIIDWKPDVILIEGSGNDDGQSGLQAAAEACFKVYADALPNVPVIVCGALPRGSAQTNFATRGLNLAAIKAACANSPNVIGFIDPCGYPTTTVAGYSSTTAYNAGDVVQISGGIWQAKIAIAANAGFNMNDWRMLSWIWGTGKTDALQNDGPRDVLTGPDNIHPTVSGQQSFGVQMAREFRRTLIESLA